MSQYEVPICPRCRSQMEIVEDVSGWECNDEYAWHEVLCTCTDESCGYEKIFREVYRLAFYEDDEEE